MTSIQKTLMSVGVSAFALFATAPVWAQDLIPTLVLTGTGEVVADPDMAIVTSGLTTKADTAREALDANNQAMSEIFAVLETAGIAATDIQTSNFSVQPEYNYNSNRDTNKITGYSVFNTVTVTVRDLDALGTMIDQFVSVGANEINGVQFTVAQTDGLYEQARKNAVEQALAKAELYAQAAGVDLVRILTISEASAPTPVYPEVAMARMAADSSVPVSAGQLTYSSTINITWEIAD